MIFAFRQVRRQSTLNRSAIKRRLLEFVFQSKHRLLHANESLHRSVILFRKIHNSHRRRELCFSAQLPTMQKPLFRQKFCRPISIEIYRAPSGCSRRPSKCNLRFRAYPSNLKTRLQSFTRECDNFDIKSNKEKTMQENLPRPVERFKRRLPGSLASL